MGWHYYEKFEWDLFLQGPVGRVSEYSCGLFKLSKACFRNQQENRDPQQAFRLWLKKKHEEQLKEKKTEELRKQEECLFFLQGTEGRERAFKQ